MKKNMLKGLAKIGIGLFLVSPYDETLTATLTEGFGIAIAPIQAPITAVIGTKLILDGLSEV